MCRVFMLPRKAVEHHRTPKRKRNYRVRNGGHALECGSVLPLLSALSITACHQNRRRLEAWASFLTFRFPQSEIGSRRRSMRILPSLLLGDKRSARGRVKHLQILDVVLRYRGKREVSIFESFPVFLEADVEATQPGVKDCQFRHLLS